MLNMLSSLNKDIIIIIIIIIILLLFDLGLRFLPKLIVVVRAKLIRKPQNKCN